MPKTLLAYAQEYWPAVAIGGGLYLAATAVKSVGADDHPERAQTNEGSPVDVPGQKLVGESDYVKVYKGQKVKALQQFGEGVSDNNHAYPVTPRTYARQTVLAYWAREISRLLGLDSTGEIFGDSLSRPLEVGDLAPRQSPTGIFDYHGMVNNESADAIMKAWNRLHPKAIGAIIDGTDFTSGAPGGVLSVTGTVDFWDAIAELAIAVDVDRAVPDSAGLAWESIYEAALEAPGVLGAAVTKVAKEASGALWQVVGAALVNIALSPVGLAAIGVAAWLYRSELGALARRVA